MATPKPRAWVGFGSGLRVGERIAIHPANDLFMRGAKYADVVRLGRKYVHAKIDAGRMVRLPYRDVVKID